MNSISAIFNALRFIWSGALDRLQFKYVYGVLVLMQISIASSMSLTAQNKISYMVVVCLVLFCVGGHFALFPNVVRQIYGRQATFLYGWMMTGTGIASLLIEVLTLSRFGEEYLIMFFITGAGSLVSMMILMFVFE